MKTFHKSVLITFISPNNNTNNLCLLGKTEMRVPNNARNRKSSESFRAQLEQHFQNLRKSQSRGDALFPTKIKAHV